MDGLAPTELLSLLDFVSDFEPLPMLGVLWPRLAKSGRPPTSERAREMVEALEEGLETAGVGLVLLGRNRRPVEVSAAAGELLEAYFGQARPLPGPVASWLDSNPTDAPLTIVAPRGRLVIRSLDSDLQLLVLQETRRTLPDIRELEEELGLSPREAQVLRLVAQGSQNDEIARELSVTVATVRKHLERIYTKLGVHSRTQAAAIALGA